MPTYRAYRLDRRRRIRSGDWIEASNDADARAQAEELCAPDIPTVELWQATRMVEQIDCEDAATDGEA